MTFCDMIAIKKRGSYEKKNSINTPLYNYYK